MSGKIRNLLAVLLVLIGVGIFAYPKLTELYTSWQSRQAIAGLEQMRVVEQTQETSADAETAESTEPTLSEMDLLRQKLVEYNDRIYEEGQADFKDPFSYQAAPIDLTEYGFTENIIATIWIPRLDVELPVYLGATTDNMAKGVALLGETSLPVSGENTNVVIAGHRGWRGTPVFRDIQLIQIGDKITLTTPWETLVYRVCELEVILPNDTNEVLIQPGRQLLTLLTCHPYTQNYQRYLVRAELSDEEQKQSREEDLEEAEKTFDASARTVVSIDENGSQQQIQVEPVSIQPVEEEGAENGASYSNQVILLEKYVPPVVLVLLALLLVFKLLRKRRKEQS